MIDIPIVEIDPEFQALIPCLAKEEKEALEKSLVEEGCREALIAWRKRWNIKKGNRTGK